jgi:hypothetical protein
MKRSPQRQASMAICVGLAASFSCTAGAFAQAQPVPQPDPAVRAEVPFPDPVFIERRYKIEAVRFKALDETGIDWWGSDEVMVGTFDAKGDTVSDEFGDVDSGDTRRFAPAKSCIVAVRPGEAVLNKTSVCDDAGEPAPLGFEVEFWEKDVIGYPTGFCATVERQPPYHYAPHCLDDGNGDDLIGRRQLDFTMQELEAALPNVGDEYIETVKLKLSSCPEGNVCGGTFFTDYNFTYRITRLPDVSIGLHSVIDEAMSKMGARSKLEAIVAGLRSLRAPSPREIETEEPSPREIETEEVGSSLDKADQLALERSTLTALDASQIRQPVRHWNPRSGVRSIVTATGEGRSLIGAYCREYQQTIIVGGRTKDAYGTACQWPDGSWERAMGEFG